ncbi:O-antigen ligase family protein [Aureliella helgolandensis]|uniref:O-Antigen ligase n=1 Tax=Aureliella helgolandensis TaxID=2527968 RepID=A0A518G696_9BACT|nr:O-antigen ligase family protein [Aureliella helgolandensis]QDV24112.1 O-Antigen ligase [Aureliella helgolandensis]
MPFLVLTLCLALGVWSVIALVRGSVFLSTALFLVSTSCLPAEFFAVDAASLTWTLDRFWFLLLAAQVAIQWYRGELVLNRLENVDVTIGLFALWLVARTMTQPLGAVLPGQPPTLMHLINGYLIPFALYAALRTARLDVAKLKPALYLLIAMGCYLSLTAFLESAKLWSFVFPHFISDPALGIHFGRARGPMLQSVRLGICIIACWLPAILFTIWLNPGSRERMMLAAFVTPLMWGAAFLTLTRSIWMGLGLVICILVYFCLKGLPQRIAIVSILFGALGVLVLKGPELVAFKREYSAAETRESTYMRAAFAYVSLEMIKDRPVSGFGFNQFQVYNRPYLSDRSTDIRLESIRGYVHHNSFLSLMVDLGIVGFALFTFVGMAACQQAMALWRNEEAPQWARGLAIILLCMGGVHLIQMAFHEVSFSSIENGFLFSAVGLVVAANQQFRSSAARSTCQQSDAMDLAMNSNQNH